MRVVIKLECSTGWWRFSFFFIFERRGCCCSCPFFGGLYFSICVFPIKMKATRTGGLFLFSLILLLVYIPLGFRSVACCCYASLFSCILKETVKPGDFQEEQHNWFRSQNFLWEIFCVYFPFDLWFFFLNYYYHFSWFLFLFLFFHSYFCSVGRVIFVRLLTFCGFKSSSFFSIIPNNNPRRNL